MFIDVNKKEVHLDWMEVRLIESCLEMKRKIPESSGTIIFKEKEINCSWDLSKMIIRLPEDFQILFPE